MPHDPEEKTGLQWLEDTMFIVLGLVVSVFYHAGEFLNSVATSTWKDQDDD